MKLLRNVSVRVKIVAVTMVAAVAALLLGGGALLSYELASHQRKLEHDLTTIARIIGANSVAAISFGDKAAAAEILTALRADPQILAACLYGNDDKALATYRQEGLDAGFPRRPGPDGFVRSGDRLTYFGPVHDQREQRRAGTLYFQADFREVRERLVSYLKILGVVFAVACLLALGLATSLQRFISKPIIDLAGATRRVSANRDYSLRLQQESQDEFGELIAGFNEMLHQIQLRDAAVQEKNHELQQANKELESFSYSVSHDLRAPLRHVQGYVTLLQRAMEGQLSEKAQRHLKTINDASVEMGMLIDDLLEFSRMGRSEMRQTHVHLDELVRDAVHRLGASEPGRKIVWKIQPLPNVLGDPAMLRHVLGNLIGNAIKYTRKRDPATIEIGRAGEEDGRVVISIQDNGAGFDMAYVHKLFGVFQRLHRADEFEGTGIGLATVHRIISRHGGRIWAEGAVGKGATFYFTLRKSNDTSSNKTLYKQ